MSIQTATPATGTSIAGLLGVAFIVLKLTHVIDWEWWWVLAPFWIPVAIFIAAVLAIGLIAMIKGRK